MSSDNTFEFVKAEPAVGDLGNREFLDVLIAVQKNDAGDPVFLKPKGEDDTAEGMAERLRAEIAHFFPQSIVVRVKDGVVSVTRYVGASARRVRKGGA